MNKEILEELFPYYLVLLKLVYFVSKKHAEQVLACVSILPSTSQTATSGNPSRTVAILFSFHTT